MASKYKRGDRVTVKYRFEDRSEEGTIVGETTFGGEPGYVFEADEGFFKGVPTAIYPEEIQ